MVKDVNQALGNKNSPPKLSMLSSKTEKWGVPEQLWLKSQAVTGKLRHL